MKRFPWIQKNMADDILKFVFFTSHLPFEQHIEAWTKWLLLCRRHFQMHFWRWSYLLNRFHLILFLRIRLTNIGQDWFKWWRRQAFTWTNDDLVHWRIYASPGFGELIPCYMMHCVLFDVQSMINRNCLGKWPKPMMTKIFDALMRHQGTILSRVRLRVCHRYSITHAVSSIITMSQCKNVPCWRHGCVIIGAFCHLSFNIHCHQRTISRRVHELMVTVIKWKHFPRHWPFVRGTHRWPVDPHKKGQ